MENQCALPHARPGWKTVTKTYMRRTVFWTCPDKYFSTETENIFNICSCSLYIHTTKLCILYTVCCNYYLECVHSFLYNCKLYIDKLNKQHIVLTCVTKLATQPCCETSCNNLLLALLHNHAIFFVGTFLYFNW